MSKLAPRCDKCGVFIPWKDATVERFAVQDMDGNYSEDERFSGLCEKHRKASQ